MSLGLIGYSGNGDGLTLRAQVGWSLSSDIGGSKTALPMLVGKAGSSLSESSNGKDLGRIKLAGEIVEELRSHGGGSETLSDK